MLLKRIWALPLLACFSLWTCVTLEVTQGPCKARQFCFVYINKKFPLKTEAPDSQRSSSIHPLRERYCRSRLMSFLSQVNIFPAAGVPQPLTVLHGGLSPLLAKLSFLPEPELVSFCSEGFPARQQIPHKQSAECQLKPIYVEANSRYLRLSPMKTRRVVHELRGKTLAAALAHLSSSPRRPALAVFRTIESALSSAVDMLGDGILKPQLVSVTANNGPVMKRAFFKARGRLNIWRRPTTHIKVIIKAL